jgi:hypothetical protein
MPPIRNPDRIKNSSTPLPKKKKAALQAEPGGA